MIDTHCHLTMMDADGAVSEAISSGVKRIITIGTDWKDSLEVKSLTEKFQGVYGVVGIHPHESKRFTPRDVERFLGLLGGKIVAIGEVGLDFYKNYSPKESQIPLFEAFVSAAAERGVPLVIHTRNAQDKTLEILSLYRGKVKGVIHCFSGGLDFARKVLDLGFYISFAGNITYNENRAKELLGFVPLDTLLLETDAPFLTPVPLRGKKNRPAYVKYTYSFVSRITGVSFEELEKRVDENATSLFGI